MATQITATLPTLDFPREVDYPTQEDWAAFSAAAEENFGILGGDWSAQMQLWKTEANLMSTELNTNATIAQGLANYQGDWTSQGYTLNQTVSVSGIYYICKLTHITGQNPTDVSSLYWNLALGNWNLKVDTNMSGYISKATPIDADLIPLSDSTESFGIKKLSWANIKAVLKIYFDTLYTVSSSETTSGVIELATTAESQSGTDAVRAITPLQLFNSLKGSNQSLSTNGYQKLHGDLIFQWGEKTGIAASSEFSVTFPITFPNACLALGITPKYAASVNNYASMTVKAETASGFTAYNNDTEGGYSAKYIAIGW